MVPSLDGERVNLSLQQSLGKSLSLSLVLWRSSWYWVLMENRVNLGSVKLLGLDGLIESS